MRTKHNYIGLYYTVLGLYRPNSISSRPDSCPRKALGHRSVKVNGGSCKANTADVHVFSFQSLFAYLSLDIF